MGAYDSALASGQRALTLATACGDGTLQIATQVQLGLVHLARGDYERAIDLLQRDIVASLEGEALYERFGLACFASVLSRSVAVQCLAEQGAFAQGITCGEEARRIAEAAEHPQNLIRIYHGVGYLYLHTGDLPKAIAQLEHGLRLCQDADILALFPYIASGLGYAYALGGRVAEALPLLEQAVEQATSMKMSIFQSRRVAWLSEVHLLAGHMQQASAFAGQAFELARVHKERGNQTRIWRLLGDIAMHRDPPDIEQAETHYCQALALANKLGMRPFQAHCHRGLGTLYAQIGQLEQARAELSTAIEMYRDMEMTFWLPEAEAALARAEER